MRKLYDEDYQNPSSQDYVSPERMEYLESKDERDKSENRLREAVLEASKTLTPQRIAMVVARTAEEAGIVSKSGLWLTWMDKAAGTNGDTQA